MTGITPQEIERIARMYASGLSIESDVRSLLQHIRSEQSRIDEAVAKERERCAGIAAGHARRADSGEFWIACQIEMAIRSPTPTTEEGA